jgi:hypothetical protein
VGAASINIPKILFFVIFFPLFLRS